MAPTPHDALPGLLVEGRWCPAQPPATPAEAALAETLRRLLPQATRLLWNVRNDLPAVAMGEIMAERMRLLGPAAMWQKIITIKE